MATTSEILLFSADVLPVQGWHISWAISKKQLDMVLHNIVEQPVAPENATVLSTARWQNTTLPVISLEQHFGLHLDQPKEAPKYLVAKGLRPLGDKQEVVRLILRTAGNITVRKPDFSCFQVSPDMLPENSHHTLAVYALVGRSILIVPDLSKIYASIDESVKNDL